jgi:O-antigen ligase
MPEPDEVLIKRIRLHFSVPLILFFLLTIGNYSFFRYTLSGSLKNSAISSIFAHLRFVLPLWPILYAFQLNLSLSLRILKHNIDVVALLFCWTLSSALSLDITSYLVYAPWTISVWIGVLLAIGFTALTVRSASELIFFYLNIIWLGNLIVLALVVISYFVRTPGPGIYTLLYSSNSFWAYPLLITGIISVIRIRWRSFVLTKRLFYVLVLAICWIAIYLSARRGPLLVLSMVILMTYLPTKFPHIVWVGSLVILLVSLIKPVDVIHHLPDSFMKYRLKRLAGLVRIQKETSYAARTRIWKDYMEDFYQNPILGTGLSGKRLNETGPTDGVHFSPHNTYVGLLAEKGLLGTALLLAIILRSLFLISAEMRRIYLLLLLPSIAINWVEYNLLPGQIFFLYSSIIWLLPRGLLLVQNQD